jgi:hypothetical protein
VSKRYICFESSISDTLAISKGLDVILEESFSDCIVAIESALSRSLPFRELE